MVTAVSAYGSVVWDNAVRAGRRAAPRSGVVH